MIRLGLCYDLRNPAPTSRSWPTLYAQALEQIAWSEQLGIDAVWLSEHHGFADGYLSQPLTMAAAIAARTEQLRIGTAVVVAPFRHPAHLAEEAWLVHNISGGRLELGLGAGYAASEFDMFDVARRDRYESTDRAVGHLRSAWSRAPARVEPSVVPPPIWLGYHGPRGAARAGQLGVGLLTLDRRRLEPYIRGLEAGGHPASTARMAGLVNILVADDPERTRHQVAPHLAHQVNTYRTAATEGSGRTPRPVSADDLRGPGRYDGVIRPTQVVSVDEAVELVATATAGLPVEFVYSWAGFGNLPDDVVLRHLELFGVEVRRRLLSPPVA